PLDDVMGQGSKGSPREARAARIGATIGLRPVSAVAADAGFRTATPTGDGALAGAAPPAADGISRSPAGAATAAPPPSKSSPAPRASRTVPGGSTAPSPRTATTGPWARYA